MYILIGKIDNNLSEVLVIEFKITNFIFQIFHRRRISSDKNCTIIRFSMHLNVIKTQFLRSSDLLRIDFEQNVPFKLSF